MFQLVPETHINFVKIRKYTYFLSSALLVATIIGFVVRGGPRLGVDFTGGTVVEVSLVPKGSAEQIRRALSNADLGRAEIQSVGTEGQYLFRFKQAGGEDAFPLIRDAIQKEIPGTQVKLLRAETVGPKIGKELRSKAIWAVLFAMGGILIYVGVRYEFIFAVGGVIALFYNVAVVLGIITLLNIELTLTVLAALLTIAGYSINDTVVIFDRIREQSRLLRRESMKDVINLSVNQTLSRTAITGTSVILTLVALLGWGGEVIRDFAFTMLLGVVIGTYCSIFVASSLALDIRGAEAKGMRR